MGWLLIVELGRLNNWSECCGLVSEKCRGLMSERCCGVVSQCWIDDKM